MKTTVINVCIYEIFNILLNFKQITRISDKFKLYLNQNVTHKVKAQPLLYITLLCFLSVIAVSVEMLVNG